MKKKALFVGLHRPDRSPSQRYRFEQYLEYLRNHGYMCTHVFLLDEQGDKDFYASGRYFRKAAIVLRGMFTLLNNLLFAKYDIVYVQREAFMLGTAFFEKQFAKRAKLIYDFDDAIWRTQTGEIKSKNKQLYFLKNPGKTREIIQHAHLVFAGNRYLAHYATQFNNKVRIVPTTIDTDLYKVVDKPPKEKVCIGWSGSFSTIIHFTHVLEALYAVKARYKDQVYFKVIGDPSFTDEKLGIQGVPWHKDTELEHLAEIDIGLMPLPDDEWTKGKCALKGLIYMSLGIPAIMSPVGVNQDIVQNGINGFLAHSLIEWAQKIGQLVESASLRKKIGLAGRELVERHYSVKANRHHYLDSFDGLLDNESPCHPVANAAY